jgi:hypothetical protein
MIFEWRSYDLLPGRAVEYLSAFACDGVAQATRHLPLGGYWLAETGVLNRIHHLWIYADLAERDACRAGLGAEAGWVQGFIPRAFPLVLRQENRLMRLVQGSDVLDAVIAARRLPHAARAADAPLFAPALMTLTLGVAPDGALAVWEVTQGEGVGQIVALSRQTEAPMGAIAHHLLRPLALSPLS